MKINIKNFHEDKIKIQEGPQRKMNIQSAQRRKKVDIHCACFRIIR